MPATTALFAVGALGAAALPPGNGFVSEWLLLQSLVHALPAGGVVTAVAMPLAVAVVALTAGVAVATFVKALGVGFFARPRAVAGTAGLVRLVTLRVTRRRAVALWDCGAGPPTARMQYTATSFAEPLQRVFDDVLAPETDVDVTPHDESRYLVAKMAYQQRVP